MLEKTDWIYDIEVYPNLFLLNCINNTNTIRKSFQISPYKDDRRNLVMWLNDEVRNMIGFNNLNYDYPVLHHLITKLITQKGSVLCNSLFQHSNNLIRTLKNKSFTNGQYIIPQIDLFRINHFDNKAKMVSLKELEFNFNMENIQELPFKYDTILTKEQIDIVSEYCFNDVYATYLLYNYTSAEIKLREELNQKFDTSKFTNMNSVKIGETILTDAIRKKLGDNALVEVIDTGDREIIKPKQTKRDRISFSNIIFGYYDFKTPECKALLCWFKQQVITELNGAFNDIDISKLQLLHPYYKENLVTKTIDGVKHKLQRNVNIMFHNEQYDFGVGGVHASTKTGIYKSDSEYVIVDLDVASFYPNLAIQNNIYPAHLSKDFCDVYKDIYNKRKLYKKGTAENLVYKLALNGSYGLSNSKYSSLYDPQYTVTITVNGQLSIMILVELVLENIEGSKMLQVNTDGATFMIKRKYLPLLNTLKSQWEKITSLTLEDVIYQKMVILNVSNYIAIKENGDIKRKGSLFIYKDVPGELEIYKNHSALVIPKAIEAYFIHGTLPEVYIKNHIDIKDFFKRAKVNRQSQLISISPFDTIQKDEQHISRYIVTGEEVISDEWINADRKTRKNIPKLTYKGVGKKLLKVMSSNNSKTNRIINLESDYLCTVINDLRLIDIKNLRDIIYYPYYINEVNKVINQFKN